MKKPLLTILIIVPLAVILFVVNPYGVFAATTAPSAQTTAQTTANLDESHSGAATTSTDHSEDAGVVGLFGLNWKLFIAQLINFAIVLFVLWRFVFKPVTSNMQERAKKIEDSLVNADRITKEKEEFEAWKNAEMSKARNEATAIISGAKDTAEKVKQETVEATKKEQQAVLDKAKQDLDNAQRQAVNAAKASIAEMVISSTEKLLKSKIDAKTDSKIIKDSMGHLEESV
ncbi:F0F1 ATP synthase subunit B [bacterium]|nr:MAG: F0F1 ATP synthase subunit B [bacterium]